MHRVGECGRHDRDRRGRVLCCDSLTGRGGQDDVGSEPNQLFCKCWCTLCIIVGVTVDDIEIAAFDVPEISHSLQKGVDKAFSSTASWSACTSTRTTWLRSRSSLSLGSPRCSRTAHATRASTSAAGTRRTNPTRPGCPCRRGDER